MIKWDLSLDNRKQSRNEYQFSPKSWEPEAREMAAGLAILTRYILRYLMPIQIKSSVVSNAGIVMEMTSVLSDEYQSQLFILITNPSGRQALLPITDI